MRAREVPNTPLEKLAERRSAIENTIAKIEDLEKSMELFTEAKTQYWGNLVQDEQLHQMNVHLDEAELQLTTLQE